MFVCFFHAYFQFFLHISLVFLAELLRFIWVVVFWSYCRICRCYLLIHLILSFHCYNLIWYVIYMSFQSKYFLLIYFLVEKLILPDQFSFWVIFEGWLNCLVIASVSYFSLRISPHLSWLILFILYLRRMHIILNNYSLVQQFRKCYFMPWLLVWYMVYAFLVYSTSNSRR